MPTVLVVDDSEVDRCLVGGILGLCRYSVTTAVDGNDALAHLDQSLPDLVVTDLRMPDMDGLDLVRAVRARYPALPVILMTGHGSEMLAVEALRQGAAGYVPKLHIADMLVGTVEEVLTLARTDREYEKLLGCLNRSDLTFFLELENDPALVDPLVKLVKQSVGSMGLCDYIGQVRIGVALKQAILNAMLRGNLELGPQPIQGSHADDAPLIQTRRKEPPYCCRRVLVDVKISRDEARFVIADEGPGFDVASLPDPIDAAGEPAPCGRGLALMRAFMDEVAFNEAGNQVTMVKRWTGGTSQPGA